MHPEIVNALLAVAERDPITRLEIEELRSDPDAAETLLHAARAQVGMTEETAKEILATYERESDRLRRADRAQDEGEKIPAEPESSPFEAKITEKSGPAFDPVGELDHFRHDGTRTESESIDLGERGKQIDRERAAGRRVLKVNQR
jgi:hypothetical protein